MEEDCKKENTTINLNSSTSSMAEISDTSLDDTKLKPKENIETSSFDGNIQEISDISVDNFENKSKMAYFLSHVHSDHTVGLLTKDHEEEYAEQLNNNGANIYMSEESKIILSRKHPHYDKIAHLVVALVPGDPYHIDLPDGNGFDVTLILVTHMVGAAMFLFKTKDKQGEDINILYTGDFVMELGKVEELTALHDGKDPITIDVMYVDGTFNTDNYKYFPERNLCYEKLVEQAQVWLNDENYRLALYTNYPFGYEDLYMYIYNNFSEEMKTPIFLQDKNEKVIQTYKELFGESCFLTNDGASKIHICSNKYPSMSHERCGVSGAAQYKHVSVAARGGCYYDPSKHQALTPLGNNSYFLCYSNHCSKDQLHDFIKHFKPKEEPRFFPKTPMDIPKYRKYRIYEYYY